MKTESQRWHVIVERSAEKNMSRLPKDVRARLLTALDRLSQDPRHPGVIKLQGNSELYRVRVGDWRIVFTIRDEQLLVIVVEVDTRGRGVPQHPVESTLNPLIRHQHGCPIRPQGQAGLCRLAGQQVVHRPRQRHVYRFAAVIKDEQATAAVTPAARDHLYPWRGV